jgi:hypothetical protein
MIKAKILIDDIGGRFKKDEIGIVLENNFDKYDYFIKLPGKIKMLDIMIERMFYFYKDEVEIIE